MFLRFPDEVMLNLVQFTRNSSVNTASGKTFHRMCSCLPVSERRAGAPTGSCCVCRNGCLLEVAAWLHRAEACCISRQEHGCVQGEMSSFRLGSCMLQRVTLYSLLHVVSLVQDAASVLKYCAARDVCEMLFFLRYSCFFEWGSSRDER